MLQTTIVLKTDWVRSTQLVQSISPEELDKLLSDHALLIKRIAHQYNGRVIKGEGDAFWLTFPSATSATQAAVDMQVELERQQLGTPETERLQMRIAIAAGDLLHKDGDVFGAAMTTTARIESLTPPDEIYLSTAAWLLLNHSQVKTSFVDETMLKGFEQPERIYKVVSHADIHHVQGEYIVNCDLMHFTQLVAGNSAEMVAHVLSNFESIWLALCTQHGGTIKAMSGDNYIITFGGLDNVLNAVRDFVRNWSQFIDEHAYDLPCGVSVNHGDYYTFRKHMFGDAINRTVWLCRAAQYATGDQRYTVLLSQTAYDFVQGTSWTEAVSEFQSEAISPNLANLIQSKMYLLQVD